MLHNNQEAAEKLNHVGLVAVGLIIVVLIGGLIISAANREPREPRPPRKPIDWEKAGEGLGDRASRFSHGVVKGAKNASKDMKEKEKGQ